MPEGGAGVLEELLLVIGATAEGLYATLTEATKKTDEHAQKMEKSFGAVGESLNSLEKIAKLVLVEKVGEYLYKFGKKLTEESFGAISNLLKLSTQLGISTEDMSVFAVAGHKVGLEVGDVANALKFMEKNLAEARSGTGAASDALKILGISLDQLPKKPAEQFDLLVERFGELKDAGDRAAAGQALFGRNWLQMVPLLIKGKDGMRQAREEAEKYGLVLHTLDAAKIKLATDAFKETSLALQGVGFTLAIKLAPFIVAVAEEFAKLADQGSNVGEAIDAAIGFAAKTIDGFRYVLRGLQIAWDVIKVSVTLFGLAIISAVNFGVRSLIYIGTLLGNFGRAMSRTNTLIVDTFKTGFKLAFEAVEGFVGDTVGVFGDMLFKVAEGMAAAGIKGADSVRSAAESVISTGGILKEKARKDAIDAKIAWTNSADDVAFAWKNILPDWSDTRIKGLDDLQAKYLDKMADFAADLNQTLNTPFDPTAVRDWTENLITEVTAAAQKVADGIAKMQADSASLYEQGEQTKLNALLGRVSAARLAEEKRYQEEMDEAKAAFAATHATQAQQNTIMEKLNEEHQSKMHEIERSYAERQNVAKKADLDTQMGWSESFFNNIASLSESHNKTLFRIGKAAGIAGAIISTARGVANALADVPYPYNFAAAAAVAIAGAVQIGKIASTSFGGGGSSSGSVGAAPASGAPIASGVTGAAAPKQALNVVLNGDRFDRQSVLDFIDNLNDATADGARINVTTSG